MAAIARYLRVFDYTPQQFYEYTIGIQRGKVELVVYFYRVAEYLHLFSLNNLLTMKTRILAILLVAIIFLESCARSYTPYEAGNSSRKSRKCGLIK
jgi:hypothetical protein